MMRSARRIGRGPGFGRRTFRLVNFVSVCPLTIVTGIVMFCNPANNNNNAATPQAHLNI